ncbi:TetR/AcrR family transcriptional regulator [Nonomuraea sp. NPDC050691]|uniref:TetR/AcrR family transcriptional regulator n=1 Tax=Nonomuraea sp. NPDC050691 TaxID=3155661 RepID=UPI0033D2A149
MLEVSGERVFVVMEESRRERKKRLTRQRIATAAVALFVEQGYEETMVAQIAAAADVDPKTFFNYFRSKDDVLFADMDHVHDLLLGAIVRRHPDEGPGEVLVRMVQEYAAHRRPEVTPKKPEELSAWSRLVLTSPALQAKGLYVLLDIQQRIADALVEAFPGQLDPITAAAMTGSLMGAIQQTTLASVRLGRTQDEMWEASRRGLDIAARGLLSVRPSAEGP